MKIYKILFCIIVASTSFKSFANDGGGQTGNMQSHKGTGAVGN